MNTAQPQVPPQQPSSLPLIVTLGGVAALSGLLVVLVFQATLPAIEANRREAIQRAVFTAIPGATSRQSFTLGANGIEIGESTEGELIYAGYGEQGELRGIAISAAGQGYQDVIRVLYGYSPSCQCITGFTVLESRETPGLGDKIYKDDTFVANFDQLDATLNSAGDGLANPIVTVKHGAKKHPWQIDAISGATVSSKAIGKMINETTQRVVPQVIPQLSRLQRSEP